jgi:predicted MPP superfamily phosphohydrolase
LDKLYKSQPKDCVSLSGSHCINGEFKRVSVTFDPKVYKTIEILHMTDLQFGAHSCKVDRIEEFITWILSEKNRFVLLGGDLIDAATPLSVASPYDNTSRPSEQALNLVKLIGRMRHRILGYVGGNHERRTEKTFGDAGRLISLLLRIPYSNGKQMIDIHFGKHSPFKIDLWHGSGSARTKGAKAQMLHRFMHQGDSQLYLVGHLHDVVLLFDWRQQRTKEGGVHLEKIAGVMSSSFQDYWGTYAEVFGLPPSDTMMARSILEPTGKWEVTLR